MTRYHTTSEGNIPFTAEEEEEFDAMEAAHAALQAERTKTQYQRDRAAEYPSINDYVDGIVKGDQAQVQAYIDACLAVKLKFPKPTE
jgi:hypothetical protein